jgi:hypothetical protein
VRSEFFGLGAELALESARSEPFQTLKFRFSSFGALTLSRAGHRGVSLYRLKDREKVRRESAVGETTQSIEPVQ